MRLGQFGVALRADRRAGAFDEFAFSEASVAHVDAEVLSTVADNTCVRTAFARLERPARSGGLLPYRSVSGRVSRSGDEQQSRVGNR